MFSSEGSKVRDAVVVLKTAKLESDPLTFDVDVLEGDLAGGDGPAALFIDRFGGSFGGFHAGGFHAAAWASRQWLPRPGASAAALIVRGLSVSAGSALSASGTIPTSLAAPGIAEATVLQRSGGATRCGGSPHLSYGATCGYL